MNERQILHHFNPRLFVEKLLGLGLLKHQKITTACNSDFQTFPEGKKKTEYGKKNPKFTYSVALVIAFFAADSGNLQLEDLSQAHFGCGREKDSLSVRTMSITENFAN